MTDLTIWTPVQIDTEIARIYDAQFDNAYRQHLAVDSLEHRLHDALGRTWREKREPYTPELLDQVCNTENVPAYTRSGLRDAEQRLLRLKAEAQDLRDELAPYAVEYRRRPWTRAFLVTNVNGHVHSSMGCSTCFPTTRYEWLIELADHDEAEIIAKAGSDACTVCYPHAPVEDLQRPRSVYSRDEKAKQIAREQRETKRAEKAAAEVTVVAYYGYQRHASTKVFKSTRAVTNDIASNLGSLTWYGPSHPDAYKWSNDVEACRKALADKGVDYDYDKALAAARKKVTRDGGQPKF